MTYALSGTTLGNLTYSYDRVGRRTNTGGSFARTALPLPVSQTTYNAGNQLAQWGTANIFYDANGNMTSSGTDGYTWDAHNRLVSTLSGGAFQYDAFGRRSSKTMGGTVTNFLYDDVNAVQELSGTTPTANLLSGGEDELFQRTDSSGASNFLSDVLGSTLGLTDSLGVIQTQYTFEPFGNTSIGGAATTNSFAYAGRELDGTGLYFNRARYYSSQFGRFISEDPAGFAGGINLYGYVDASPTNATDPSGLWSTDAHNQIVWNALHPCGVSNHDIWQIQQGSKWADTFQDPAHSYMHSMRDGALNQTPAAALAQRDQYIAATMTVATNQLQAGQSDQALFTFGAAMHPIMDMTSPAHTDADGNPIAWCSAFTGCSQTLDHGGDSDPGNNPLSIENVAHLNANPHVQELENALIRARYRALTGRGCNCH